MSLDCTHEETEVTKQVCSHVLVTQDPDYLKYFYGVGLSYHLICRSCSEHLQGIAVHLRSVCEACFQNIEVEGFMDSIKGASSAARGLTTKRFINIGIMYGSKEADIFQHLRQIVK